MRRLFGVYVVVTCALVTSLSAQARVRNPLVGAWTILEVTLADGTVRKDYAPSQYTFTERHYSAQFSRGYREPFGHSTAAASDAEIVAAFRKLTASSGTYDYTDSTYTTHPVVGADPQAQYAGRTWQYRVRGDTLLLTDSARGATPPGIRSITLVRVE